MFVRARDNGRAGQGLPLLLSVVSVSATAASNSTVCAGRSRDGPAQTKAA